MSDIKPCCLNCIYDKHRVDTIDHTYESEEYFHQCKIDYNKNILLLNPKDYICKNYKGDI